MKDLEDLEDDESPLCFNCAERLGKYTWPEIPELLFGYCPQCGGTKPLGPAAKVVSLTPPGARTEATRDQQVA